MRPKKELKYNPSLSPKENARRNGVSVATVRKYIHENDIDRRFDRKQAIIDDCRAYLKKHPKATQKELSLKTGHSQSTIRQYRAYILTENELTVFDKEKSKRRQLRQQNNYYATHPSVTQDLLREETFSERILEPFCGGGTMAEVIKQNGHKVEAYDIIDRGYGKEGDFFKIDIPAGVYDIITNPPYDDNLVAIIKRCLSLCKNKVAILMPVLYLSGKERNSELYSKFPPARVYVYCERVTIAKNGDFQTYNESGANMTVYAWYIWEKGYVGNTELRWIHNVKTGEEEPSQDAKEQEVRILDNIPFKPTEQFQIPVDQCIQFHSKALPENRILSNHYDCIITFRGVEFYAVEQLYWALNYSDNPAVLRKIMGCSSGIKAKSLCEKKYPDKRDIDFEEKQWRVIALCHLYKYLSVKEYRERLRETYSQCLVECPPGKDYKYGLVQNLDTNIFEGNNCSGRTTMIVRDKMMALEKEAVEKRQNELGRNLTPEETEQAYEELYGQVREKFDNDKQIIRDSKPLMTVIEKYGIPKVKQRRPKPFVPPVIDRNTKCLVVDFDDTLFDTSADDQYRKVERGKDINKAMEKIPEYKLYDGWREVIDWTKKNGVKIAVLSAALGSLIEKALKHFGIPYAAVIGYQMFLEKPDAILGNMLQDKLNIRHDQIIYVGNSAKDETQARASQFRFIGAAWHSQDSDYFTQKGVQTVNNPIDLIPIMQEAGWGVSI